MTQRQTGTGPEPVLEVRGIRKSFGRRQVLRDVSFDVPRGRIVAITGENGAGKTTLLRIIVGLLAPDAGERDAVHRIIIDELSRGQVREQSRATYLRIIDRLARAGAQGVVLGCTEIPLLVRPEHTTLPLFDTATIHAEAALMRALE